MKNPILLLAFGALLVLGTSCKHHPEFTNEPDPTDTTNNNPIDTVDISDGIDTTGWPCDPDSIYFEYDVLPILISNCTMSDCHDAVNPEEGVNLTDWQHTVSTGEVVPFNLNNSELWEAITETDPDKIMPPPPMAPLTPEQKAIISAWIMQGATNNTCNPNYGVCDTTNVTFTAVVKPIMQTACVGCHSGSSPDAGINLSTHAGVQAIALDGSLMGSIKHLSGYSAMPKGSTVMPACQINKIQAWVNAGAPNN